MSFKNQKKKNVREEEKGTRSNILLSIEYLMEEAKRDGDLQLYQILKTTHHFGKTASPSKKITISKEMMDDEKTKLAVFFYKFLSAPESVQKEFVSIIESIDSTED
ncbi:MAG: hypothetical protein OEY94_05585 [Alphaproteobacteria bacterium]|nr:hypothetical protein [Alphaproteobacteria bacterium]